MSKNSSKASFIGHKQPSTSILMLENERDDIAYVKASFYRSLLSFIALFLCLVVTYSAVQRDEIVLLLKEDANGHIVNLKPESTPSITENNILSKASEDILFLNRLSFTDIKTKVNKARGIFFEESWIAWQKSLERSDQVIKLKSQKLTQIVQPLSAPRIIDSGYNGRSGRYEWTIQMKIYKKLEGGDISVEPTNMLITLIVSEVSRVENSSGLLIRQYIEEPIQ